MSTRTLVSCAAILSLLSSGATTVSCAKSSTSGFDENGDASAGATAGGSTGAGGTSGGSGGDDASEGSSSGGPSGSTSGSSTGGGISSGSSSGTAADGGMCKSAGGLPLTGTEGNYLTSPAGASPVYGGFAFVLEDSMSEGCGSGPGEEPCGTSVGYLAEGEFCGCGTTGVKVKTDAGTYPTYGAGIGANLGQAVDGGVAPAVTISAAGLTYAVTSVPPNSMEIEIKDGTTDYCYVTTVASGTIMWSDFVEKCTSTPPGAAFAGTSITGVSFQARASETAAEPYDFCVTTLSL